MQRFDATLTIDSDEPDLSRLDAMTRAVARSLQAEGIDAAVAGAPDTVAGSKGDAVTVGTIALSLIGSGGVVVTLLQVLKAYLERKSSISFQVTRPDGQKVTVNASTFGAAQLEQTRKLLTDLLRT